MRRALIVDDDICIRDLATIALEACGWEVLAVASGAEAIQLARTHKLDAILLDLMMPAMDGPTTLDKLKGDPETRDTPVVLLTANSGPEDIATLQGLKVAGLVSKPFNPRKLGQQLEDLLRKS